MGGVRVSSFLWHWVLLALPGSVPGALLPWLLACPQEQNCAFRRQGHRLPRAEGQGSEFREPGT